MKTRSSLTIYHKTTCLSKPRERWSSAGSRWPARKYRQKKASYEQVLLEKLNDVEHNFNKLQLENAGLKAENELLKNQLTYFQDLFAKQKGGHDKSTASASSNRHSGPFAKVQSSDKSNSYERHSHRMFASGVGAQKMLAETTSDDEIYSATKVPPIDPIELLQKQKQNNSYNESSSSKLSQHLSQQNDALKPHQKVASTANAAENQSEITDMEANTKKSGKKSAKKSRKSKSRSR